MGFPYYGAAQPAPLSRRARNRQFACIALDCAVTTAPEHSSAHACIVLFFCLLYEAPRRASSRMTVSLAASIPARVLDGIAYTYHIPARVLAGIAYHIPHRVYA